jgi:hypothetical protein
MTNIGMLTPERSHMERSKFYKRFLSKEIFDSFFIAGLSLLEINRRAIVSPFHNDDDDTSFGNQFASYDNAKSPTKNKPKAWSVRARRDVPNLLRGDR